jgi:predicted transposase/invertase (TIGR01784 family)
MKKIFFTDADDPVDICFDNVFKAVFVRDTPESKGALSNLISALIGRDVSINAISVNEPPVENIRDRQIRFDINCRAENGDLVNVEMSLNPNPFELVRLEFYAGKLFIGQDIKGSTYDKLKQAYQIAILVKERFFTDEEFYHTFEYYDKIRNTSLKGRSRIITLELSKLDLLIEKPIKELNVYERWAIYFKYLTDKEKRSKINEIVEHEEGIAMASEVLMTISKDEIERARLMSEFKYQVDLRSHLVYAEQKGKTEGKQKKSKEIAQKLKARGRPLDEIAEDTGLLIEVIEKL